jgi:hypothetical protein
MSSQREHAQNTYESREKRNLYSVGKPSTIDLCEWVSNSVVEYSAFNRLAVGSNPT